jgi:hypothetical protein
MESLFVCLEMGIVSLLVYVSVNVVGGINPQYPYQLSLLSLTPSPQPPSHPYIPYINGD